MASAETTSAGISSATAAATSDFPLAVGPNKPMTGTALGDGERELRAGERHRRRARDCYRDDVALSGVAGEVDRRVASCPAPQKFGLGSARPLDEHFFDDPDPARVSLGSDPLHDLDQ